MTMPSKRKPAAKPKKAPWEDFGPADGLYWAHGGPWIPPEEIPPDHSYGLKPEYIRPHDAPLKRLKAVRDLLESVEAELAGDTKSYVAAHEHGIDGLEEEWMKEIARKDDPAKPPGYVHRRLALRYHHIRMAKAKRSSYEALIDSLESDMTPLFSRNRKPS
jgi:hypothetical protein